MTVSVTSRWIDIPTFQGYLAPPKTGSGPAVIILQEIFGVNSHIHSVADQYAADGYVALAPDVFWRTQPRVKLGYEGADREKAMELLQKTQLDTAIARCQRSREGVACAARSDGQGRGDRLLLRRPARVSRGGGRLDRPGRRLLRRRHPERARQGRSGEGADAVPLRRTRRAHSRRRGRRRAPALRGPQGLGAIYVFRRPITASTAAIARRSMRRHRRSRTGTR